jgi:N-acyl-D-glutamate deacylase
LRLWQLATKYNVPTCTHTQNLSIQDPKSGTSDMINLMGLAAATGAHTHVCHWNSTSLRDIPVIREIVNNAQRAGLKITTEAMCMELVALLLAQQSSIQITCTKGCK